MQNHSEQEVVDAWRTVHDVSYQRFKDYIKLYRPSLRKGRRKMDMCDTCLEIEIKLADPDLGDEDRQHFTALKKQHLDFSRNQRRMMKGLIDSSIARMLERGQHVVLPDIEDLVVWDVAAACSDPC